MHENTPHKNTPLVRKIWTPNFRSFSIMMFHFPSRHFLEFYNIKMNDLYGKTSREQRAHNLR